MVLWIPQYMLKDKQSSPRIIGQVIRYRGIISNYKNFDKELDKFKMLFHKKKLPPHIVDHEYQKSSSLSRDVAFRESNRKAMNRNWSNQKANHTLKTKAGNK